MFSTITNMNPIHAMPQISKKPVADPAIFSQVTLRDYSDQIKIMKGFLSDPAKTTSMAVDGFRRAIRSSKKKMAVNEFSRFYHNKELCVKVLLEIAIDVVPVSNLGLVNWVFWAMSEEALDSAIIPVLIIRELCKVDTKNAKGYVDMYNTDLSIQEMIEEAGDTCATFYTKLEACGKKYHTYPLYLRDNAKSGAGSLVHKIDPEDEADVELAGILESI